MTITKERLLKIQQWRETYGPGSNVVLPAEEAEELARIALASLEVEPVAYMHRSGQVVTREECCDDKTFAICCKVETPLYSVRPAPVANIHPLLEFAREYIESWDLGMAGDSSLLASAKKAIADSSAHHPAQVSVPDEVMAAMQKVARIRLDLNDFDGDKRGILDCLGDAEEALIEVVNRRAAMLQGDKS